MMTAHHRSPEMFLLDRERDAGYTLIELSIVVIIIGLITGAVFSGQDLIRSAATRAQIAQIDKYNSAVNAFDAKYGGLPGDLPLAIASTNGLITNGCDGKTGGMRDGNGLIEGGYQAGNPTIAYDQFHKETALFWEDLGTTGMINSSFPVNGAALRDCTMTDNTVITLTTGAYAVANFIPAGRVGYGQYIYVYANTGDNYFGLSAVTGTGGGNSYSLLSTPNLPVIIAANIDQKIDDGQPLSGNVLTQYLNFNSLNASPNWTSATSTVCYDTSTTNGNYDTKFNNNGLGQYCALSFKIQ